MVSEHWLRKPCVGYKLEKLIHKSSTWFLLTSTLARQVAMAFTGSTAAVGCLLLRVPSSHKTQPAKVMNPLLSPNATRTKELNSLHGPEYLEVAGSEEPPVGSLLPHTASLQASH